VFKVYVFFIVLFSWEFTWRPEGSRPCSIPNPENTCAENGSNRMSDEFSGKKDAQAGRIRERSVCAWLPGCRSTLERVGGPALGYRLPVQVSVIHDGKLEHDIVHGTLRVF
jgi:hypothetical protein